MERCPACRARLNDQSTCPRCGCDLELALRAEAQAETASRQAIHAWLNGDPALAARRARAAEKLANTPLRRALSRWLAVRNP